MLFDVGIVCVKLAGRDAGKKCVVVDVIDEHYVLIDGQTRRRKCNVAHLEPLKTTLKIAKGASSEAVAKAFEGINVIVAPVSKSKKAAARPKRLPTKKVAPAKK